jgi:HTH-type transcriptional regulator / antitoxin HigA
MRNTKVHISHTADDYLDLIRQFSLRRLHGDSDHAEAVRILARLIGRKEPRLSAGERDYAEALGLFVQEYDERVHPFPKRKSTPLQALRYLMEQNDMNSESLGKVLGNKTAASLVLNGKRELSKAHIRKLADRFKVDPGLFF